MNRMKRGCGCMFLVAGVLAGTSAWAGPTTNDTETWNGGGLEGWSNNWNEPPNRWWDASIDNPGTYLRVTSSDPGGVPTLADSIALADNGVTDDPYTGNYISLLTPGKQLFVEFEYQAQTRQANELAVYLMSDQSGTARVWSYSLGRGPAVGGFASYSVRLDSANGWVDELYGTGSAGDFLADVAAVNWIGVYVEMFDSTYDIFGLDNFELRLYGGPDGKGSIMTLR